VVLFVYVPVSFTFYFFILYGSCVLACVYTVYRPMCMMYMSQVPEINWCLWR